MKNFGYIYDAGAGPLPLEDILKEEFTVGNCRFAVQYFLYKDRGIYLGREQIILPGAYRDVGEFVFENTPVDWSKLTRGDIIYAEARKGKNGKIIDRSRQAFTNEDDWIMHQHSAIFIGEIKNNAEKVLPEGNYPEDVPLVWHSSFIAGGSCVWTLEKFEEYYKPISVKRIG